MNSELGNRNQEQGICKILTLLSLSPAAFTNLVERLRVVCGARSVCELVHKRPILGIFNNRNYFVDQFG